MTIQDAAAILESEFAEFGAYLEAQNTILATCEREGTRTFINKMPATNRDAVIRLMARKLTGGAL